MRQIAHWLQQLRTKLSLNRLLNRGLPPQERIKLRVRWPLVVLLLAIINQMLTPMSTWMTLIVVLVGAYLAGYLWVRALAGKISVERTRTSSILVAGDVLHEEFVISNSSRVPLLWGEFVDESTLPDYQPGRATGCPALSHTRWRSTAECKRRGVHRLGPHQLTTGDPLFFYSLTIAFEQSENVLIYPRVVQLPRFQLPRGSATGDERQRRPLIGSLPASSVRHYQEWDSLRYVHWPTSAHRGQLMVRELELEPAGDVWIALDANRTTHRSEGERNTFEMAIIAAASLAARLVDGSERRAVGLLSTTSKSSANRAQTRAPTSGDPNTQPEIASSPPPPPDATLITVPPGTGQAHLWRIMAALAPLEMASIPLAEMLRSARSQLGRRRSLVVIGALEHDDDQLQRWLAELVHLQRSGIASSVLLITTSDETAAAEEVRNTLVRHAIDVHLLPLDAPLRPLLTYRRRRLDVRSTPTGGAITVEVEEEVG
jgi:uncharacterized protein (DUF58 family)